jgi:type IV pilus assembly protein PilX
MSALTLTSLQKHRQRFPQQQKGIVLIVALLVLVALTIASLGLLRSVDTTTAATGNLGFKKDLYRQSNRGVQSAMAALLVLRTAGDVPFNSVTSSGYYATTNENPVDPRGIPLRLLQAPVPATPGVAPTTAGIGRFAVPIGDASGGGYVFRYTAERLCPNAGEPDDSVNKCRKAAGAGTSSTPSQQKVPPLSGKVFVRLTLRVDGPKNSVSYFQMMVL